MFGLTHLLSDVCARSALAASRVLQRCAPVDTDHNQGNALSLKTSLLPQLSFALDDAKVSKIAERACGLRRGGGSLEESHVLSLPLTLDQRRYASCFDGESLCLWLCQSGLAESLHAASFIAQRLIEARLIRSVSRSLCRVFCSPHLLYVFINDCAPVSDDEEQCEIDWKRLNLDCERVRGWIDAACIYFRSKRRVSLSSIQSEIMCSELIRFLKRRRYVPSVRDALLVGLYAYHHALLRRVDGLDLPFKFADVEMRRVYAELEPGAVTAFEGAPEIHGARRWEFVQSFGDDNNSSEENHEQEQADDLVTAIEFSADGAMLAIGDKAGRVSVVEQIGGFSHLSSSSLEYAFYTEFQSHEPEFDSLKSAEIGARINAIEWCRYQARHATCLTANDRTIKVWSLPTSKALRLTSGKQQYTRRSLLSSVSFNSEMTEEDDSPVANGALTKCRQTMGGVHSWPIHSLSASSDGVSFLSADDLTCLIWDIEHSDEALLAIDVGEKGLHGQTLDELLTVARYHPQDGSILAHSSSKGLIRIADLREACCVNKRATMTMSAPRPRLSVPVELSALELSCSILDLRWSAAENGRYLVARDYLQCHLYDLRHPAAPMYSTSADPRLLNTLGAAVDSEMVFDAFHCAISPDARWLVSGTYSNMFGLHEPHQQRFTLLRAKDDSREPQCVALCRMNASGLVSDEKIARINEVVPLDFGRACLKVAWHPKLNAVAVSGLYKLYLYSLA